jgi:phosphatidylglycerophosphate synthase
MNWFVEYKKSLKNINAEEVLDIYLFRPFAFIIVKLFYSLPLTPNHYSFASFVSGMTAAYFFYTGQLQWGAFFFFMFAVLDCCDGMQARMKKNGTEFGRFIDGLVDYTCNFACYIALAFGLDQMYPNIYFLPTFWLVILAGLGKAIHSFLYDHYLMEYMAHEKGEVGFVDNELTNIKEKIDSLKNDPKATLIRKMILWAYYGYSSLQAGKKSQIKKYDSHLYVQYNLKLIQFWGLIGPAWHVLILIVALFLNFPAMLFSYAIVTSNLWMIFMIIYQQNIFKKLEKLSQATS